MFSESCGGEALYQGYSLKNIPVPTYASPLLLVRIYSGSIIASSLILKFLSVASYSWANIVYPHKVESNQIFYEIHNNVTTIVSKMSRSWKRYYFCFLRPTLDVQNT